MSNSTPQPPLVTHLTCSLTGHAFTPSSEIVVTPSGHICEKRLLLSKLTENGGMDPFETHPPITLDEKDLISLSKSSNSSSSCLMPPRPSTASSLPNLLHMLQEEYDGIMLELYDTRSALEETRKELSQALYQNDAAVRVIARLTMERDHARQRLTEKGSYEKEKEDVPSENATTTATVGDTTEVMETTTTHEESSSSKKRKLETDDSSTKDTGVTSGIPSEHVNAMVSKWKTLSKARRKKTPPPSTHATIDILSQMTYLDKQNLHKTSGKAGIHCCSIDQHWITTGGNDKNVIVYNSQTQSQVGSALTGSTKEILCVTSMPSHQIVLSGSADGNVRAYHHDPSIKSQWKLFGKITLSKYQNRQSPIVGLELQPTQQYILAISATGEISISHLSTSPPTLEHLHSFHSKEEGTQYTCAAIHPDGLILGIGTQKGTLELWDLRNQALVSTMSNLPSESPMTSLSFSENGYHVISSQNDGTVILHDIRKLGSTTKSTTLAQLNDSEDPKGYVGTTVNAVAFDPSGKFVMYGGDTGIVVVAVKEWKTVLCRLDVDNAPISDVAWSSDAKSIVSVSSTQRGMQFWGLMKEKK